MTCDLLFPFHTSAQQRRDIAADIADGMGSLAVRDGMGSLAVRDGMGSLAVSFSQEGGGETCDGDEIKCVMIDQRIAQQVSVFLFAS